MHELQSISSRGAAACYRRDAMGRRQGESFGPHDGTWIEVASLLEHAAPLESHEAAVLLRDAIELAESVVDESQLSIYCGPTPSAPGDRGMVETIQLLTQELEEAGAVNLATLILESLAAANPEMSPLELGRVTAQRARILWKTGKVEQARMTYRRLERLADLSGEIELRIRAWIGFMALAQLENNDAALRRWAASAVRLAERHGYPALARIGYNGLTVAAARARRFNQALVHGWKAYELADGNPVILTEILQNLGQMLYDAGHAEPSRAAFASILSTTQPARIGLHALGGYALASSALRDTAGVQWATTELYREAARANAPLPAASAFCECAISLLAIGDVAGAATARATSIEVATAGGYYALAARALSLRVGTDAAAGETLVPCALTQQASRVARRIGSLQPSSLPFHVSFIAAA